MLVQVKYFLLAKNGKELNIFFPEKVNGNMFSFNAFWHSSEVFRNKLMSLDEDWCIESGVEITK